MNVTPIPSNITTGTMVENEALLAGLIGVITPGKGVVVVVPGMVPGRRVLTGGGVVVVTWPDGSM